MNIDTSPQFGSLLLDLPQLPVGKPDNVYDSSDGEPVIRLKTEGGSTLPARRSNHSGSTTSGVTSNTLKRIQQEIDTADLDMRVVMSECRGLKRGTSSFEDAYIAGRLEALGINRKSHAGIPHMVFSEDWRTVTGSGEASDSSPTTYAPTNPYSVVHLGHLVKFFGPWLAVLLACQIFTAWTGSVWTDRYLEGGRYFHAAIIMLVFLSANSAVWFKNQGNHCNAFLKPGSVVLIVSLTSCVALHLFNKISHLG